MPTYIIKRVSDELYHHGIKGQKWGVRRFENLDGTLTAEGKERYGKSSKQLKEKLDKEWVKTLKRNFELADKYADVYRNGHYEDYLKKPLSKIQLTPDEKRKADGIISEMFGNKKTMQELDNKIFDVIEKEYVEKAKNRKLSDIDPAYRKFSSKDEKAKAEAEYFKNLNSDDNLVDDCAFMMRKISTRSIDWYNGVPKSDRQKAMYDYVETGDSFDTYDNWIRKYESSNEWKRLKKQEKDNAVVSGYNKAQKDYYDDDWSNDFTYKKLKKAYDEAYEKYKALNKPIKDRQNRIKGEFQQQMLKNVLLDLGYEPTQENINGIIPFVMWD